MTSDRPPAAVRIGVTGHRTLPGSPGFTANLDNAVRRAAQAAGLVEGSSCTVVSALAEGADRIAVERLRDLFGCKLEALLPLPPDEFEIDFAQATSKAEFRQWLQASAQIDVVEPGVTRNERYEAAGLAMLDRIDVLIALWDGLPARGRGGTAEIVDAARRRGLPVVWLSTLDPFPIVYLNGEPL
jgi:hypothetical protein